jgi:tRNA A-37 threonylcarbamoyl transferase component Bud32
MQRCPHCANPAPAGDRYCGRCGNALATSSELATEVLPHGVAARLIAVAAEERFPPGIVLSERYRIVQQVGRGGMGEVYRATDMLLGQTVALKFLPQERLRSQEAVERLRGEVRLARQISHPNVCRVYDMGETGGQLFLTMEFIDGENLSSLLRRIGRLPGDKALQVARSLCSALAAAHEKGVLHRDLKPANVMIDGRGHALITDFGLAVGADGARPEDLRSGTPAYMAPEQLAGVEVTFRSDLYSLGIVLYELFTGKPPFSEERDFRQAQQSAPAPVSSLVPDIDPKVEQAIARCLQTDPANRPGSAMAVAASLPGGDPLSAALAAGETPSPELVAAAEPVARMSRGAAAASLAVLFLGLGLTAGIRGGRQLVSALGAENDGSAMAQTSRDILAALGYPGKPAWSDWGYSTDDQGVRRLRAMSREMALRELAKDSPLYFWYRAASGPIAGQGNPFRSWVSETDPPLSAPGMMLLILAADRRVKSLVAIPPAHEETGTATPIDPAKLFAIARLEPARFREAGPVWTPSAAFDARTAWVETGAANPLRVEAATWNGRPVFFKVDLDRAPNPDAPGMFSPASLISFVLRLGLLLALGWHNLRRGRVDRKGAARLATFIGIAVLALHLFQATLSIDLRGYYLLVSMWGNALWAGSMCGLGYIAIEPLVRKRWPRALITWARLLNGNARDPAVAQDVLVGLTFGATVAVVISTCEAFLSGIALCWPFLVSSSAAHIASGLLGVVADIVVVSAGFYCALLLFAAICRNRWLGAGCVAVLMSAAGADPSRWLAWFVVGGVLYGLGAAFAFRYGYLALTAAALVVQMMGLFPVTLDLSSFYAASSIAVLGVLSGLGLYCYQCVAAEPRTGRGPSVT